MITHTAPYSTILITQSGIYKILYSVTTSEDTADNAVFAIQVNKCYPTITVYCQSNGNDTFTRITMVFEILSITVPATVALVNIGNDSLDLENTLDGEQLVNAFMTIIRLA